MARLLKNQDGSVLPVVFLFAVITVISVLAYVSGQYRLARPVLSAPSDFQALLNARSGIWKGLEMVNHPPKDTLKRINTLDSLFNASLFGKQTEAITKDEAQLAVGEPPSSVPLFGSDSFGACEIALDYHGCFKVIQAQGIFRNSKKNVEVKLGCVYPLHFDTVVFLDKNPPLQKPIRGKVSYRPDTSMTPRIEEFNKFLSFFQSEMTDTLDTMKSSPPLLIQHNDEFDKIPKTVHGPLFIDGSHFDLTWNAKKRVVVLGDLQVTGKTMLGGMDFLVTGEIKLLDDTRMRDAFLLTPQTITMGDRCVFSGTAMTLARIVTYGVASVENRSMLVAIRNKTAPSPTPPKPGDDKKKKLAVFPITITESSTVDATVISIGDSLGVKIDHNAVVKGILWTKGSLSLDGKVIGRVHASKFVDGALAISGRPSPALSIFRGDVLPLEDREVRKYSFPFFMGKVSILEWVED
jgi:hypothetical protein